MKINYSTDDISKSDGSAITISNRIVSLVDIADWIVIRNTTELTQALSDQKKNIYIASGDYTISTPIVPYDNLHLKGEHVADGQTLQNGVRFLFDNSSPLFQKSSTSIGSGTLSDGPSGGEGGAGPILREHIRVYLDTPLGVDLPAGTLMVVNSSGRKYTYELVRTTTAGENWIYIRHTISVTEPFVVGVAAIFYPPSCRDITLENIKLSGETDAFDLTYVKGLTLRHVELDDQATTAGYGWIAFCTDVTMSYCNANWDNGNLDLQGSNGVDISHFHRAGSGGDDPSNIGIDECIGMSVSDCRGGGYYVNYCYNFEFDNCHMSGVHEYNEFIFYRCQYFSLINCSTGDVGSDGFDLGNCDNFTVTGCNAPVAPLPDSGTTNAKIFGNSWQKDQFQYDMDPQDGDILNFNTTSGVWESSAPPVAPVPDYRIEVYSGATQNNTPYVLGSFEGFPNATLGTPRGTYVVKAYVSATKEGSDYSAGFELFAVIKFQGTPGEIVGTVNQIKATSSIGADSWDATFTCTGTDVNLQVIGHASPQTIWDATVIITESINDPAPG